MPPPWLPAGSPPGTPTNTVAQNVVGNVAAAGAVAVANGVPFLANSATGIGTAEASAVAIWQGWLAQQVKHLSFVDEKHWLEPFMAVVGVPVSFVLVGLHLFVTDPLTALTKTVLVAVQGVGIAKVQYHAAQASVVAGAMAPVAPEKEYAANPHFWPAPNSPGWGFTAPPASTGVTNGPTA